MFVLLGLVIIFIALVYFSRLSSLNINNIEISGNQIVETSAIKDVVQQQISGKYFFFFPKSDIFIYPGNAIKNALENKFKILENINVSVKTNHTLVVTLSERKGVYTWCGMSPDVGIPTSGDNCYFIDDNGYIFNQAPYFSGEVYFKFYGVPDAFSGGDPSGLYFEKQYFTQLTSFKDTLISLGLKPISIYVTSEDDVEVFLSSANPGVAGPYIIFKLDGDYETIAENLEAALTTEPLQSEFQNKYSSLQYIDVRFGNKVYFK